MNGKYNAFEGFRILFQGFRTIKYLKRAKKNGIIDEKFQERLMLAVTEVNGCAMCSYAHTQKALEIGLDAEHIKELLGGSFDEVPDAELPAVLFAQHYAEKRGKPSKKVWEQIVKDYKKPLAMGILGSIRMIMIGNAYGMPFGSFIHRFTKDKSKRDKRSSFGYEMEMLLTVLPFFIIAFILSIITYPFPVHVI